MGKFAVHLKIRMTSRHIHDPESDLSFFTPTLENAGHHLQQTCLYFHSGFIKTHAHAPTLNLSPSPVLAWGRVLCTLRGLLAKQQRVAGF